MPTYHKLCQAYQINKSADFKGYFEWIVGKQYGPINTDRPCSEDTLPSGFASAALCRLVREYSTAGTLSWKVNPIVGFADLSFSSRLSEQLSLGHYNPQCIFMIDCPAFVAESVLVSIHLQIMGNFSEELKITNSLSYGIYSYKLDEQVIEFLSQ